MLIGLYVYFIFLLFMRSVLAKSLYNNQMENKLQYYDSNLDDNVEFEEDSVPFQDSANENYEFDDDTNNFGTKYEKRQANKRPSWRNYRKRQCGIIYGDGRPIGILKPYADSYKFLPVKQETVYSLESNPQVEFQGDSGLNLMYPLQRNAREDSDADKTDEFASLLTNFKVHDKLHSSDEGKPAKEGNKMSKNKRESATSDKIEEELGHLVDDMGLAEADESEEVGDGSKKHPVKKEATLESKDETTAKKTASEKEDRVAFKEEGKTLYKNAEESKDVGQPVAESRSEERSEKFGDGKRQNIGTKESQVKSLNENNAEIETKHPKREAEGKGEAKMGKELENESKKPSRLSEDEDLEEGSNKISLKRRNLQKQLVDQPNTIPAVNEDHKVEKKEIKQNAANENKREVFDLLQDVQKSGDISVTGNRNPIAYKSEADHSLTNTKKSPSYEENVERQIRDKIAQIREEVKREIQELEQNENDYDEQMQSQRLKRQTLNTLIDAETSNIDPNKNVDGELIPHVRRRRNISYNNKKTIESKRLPHVRRRRNISYNNDKTVESELFPHVGRRINISYNNDKTVESELFPHLGRRTNVSYNNNKTVESELLPHVRRRRNISYNNDKTVESELFPHVGRRTNVSYNNNKTVESELLPRVRRRRNISYNNNKTIESELFPHVGRRINISYNNDKTVESELFPHVGRRINISYNNDKTVENELSPHVGRKTNISYDNDKTVESELFPHVGTRTNIAYNNDKTVESEFYPHVRRRRNLSYNQRALPKRLAEPSRYLNKFVPKSRKRRSRKVLSPEYISKIKSHIKVASLEQNDNNEIKYEEQKNLTQNSSLVKLQQIIRPNASSSSKSLKNVNRVNSHISKKRSHIRKKRDVDSESTTSNSDINLEDTYRNQEQYYDDLSEIDQRQNYVLVPKRDLDQFKNSIRFNYGRRKRTNSLIPYANTAFVSPGQNDDFDQEADEFVDYDPGVDFNEAYISGGNKYADDLKIRYYNPYSPVSNRRRYLRYLRRFAPYRRKRNVLPSRRYLGGKFKASRTLDEMNRPYKLTDMSPSELFGGLPQNYNTELSRFKRIKRSKPKK